MLDFCINNHNNSIYGAQINEQNHFVCFAKWFCCCLLLNGFTSSTCLRFVMVMPFFYSESSKIWWTAPQLFTSKGISEWVINTLLTVQFYLHVDVGQGNPCSQYPMYRYCTVGAWSCTLLVYEENYCVTSSKMAAWWDIFCPHKSALYTFRHSWRQNSGKSCYRDWM